LELGVGVVPDGHGIADCGLRKFLDRIYGIGRINRMGG
jgi:hypothetical protein